MAKREKKRLTNTKKDVLARWAQAHADAETIRRVREWAEANTDELVVGLVKDGYVGAAYEVLAILNGTERKGGKR